MDALTLKYFETLKYKKLLALPTYSLAALENNIKTLLHYDQKLDEHIREMRGKHASKLR